ncbi:hypothetical protein TALK_13475 [Thalassospira alkalitolerans]|uniref:Uncharacterized protein n=2 Tax=Thalassospira alkalitolerans TaxID=1293890 RepID=A0A1Y2LA79_9PROT|nr:hypothetical protein TALK_13475 [Thalassospira alkalitolerans]
MMAGAGGIALASLPLDQAAEAGEAKAATSETITNEQATTPGERGLDAVQGRDDMAAYSRDPNSRGIGIFINLQADTTIEQGQDLGDWLKGAFASRDIPVEYRINQSRGTATDLTFYVKGYDFTVNVGNLKTELSQVLAHHRGAWLPETVALNTQPQ